MLLSCSDLSNSSGRSTRCSDLVDLPADGKFSRKIGVGSYVVEIYGPNMPSSVWKAAYDHRSNLDVPEAGLTDFIFKVRKQTGFLVRFETNNPQGIKGNYTIQLREPGGKDRLLGLPDEWFYPAGAWGEKREIRVIGRHNKEEIVPWTTITADPKNWPLVIRIP